VEAEPEIDHAARMLRACMPFVSCESWPPNADRPAPMPDGDCAAAGAMQ
jgi:hypothetical protein